MHCVADYDEAVAMHAVEGFADADFVEERVVCEAGGLFGQVRGASLASEVWEEVLTRTSSGL